MHYTLLGNTGLVVSRLAFGAMTFSAGNKDIAAIFKVEGELADRLVGRSLDSGINLFDTADAYAGGESEVLLGRALKACRDHVVITTKVGFRSGPTLTQAGLSRRHILWSVDHSLKRLGTDWIDLYVAHREDPLTPLEETLAALNMAVQSGKVRYIGFSNWSAWKVAAALEIQRANGLAPFTHGQMNYSLLGRDVERDVIPMMRHFGLGLTVWSPLASGFLSGTVAGGLENGSTVDHSGDAVLKTLAVSLEARESHGCKADYTEQKNKVYGKRHTRLRYLTCPYSQSFKTYQIAD
jgi:aryl-alcohol dehydrogenase-like predicted oxidoreductase